MKTEPAIRQVEDCQQITIGDILLRRKSLVMHIGVYLGDNRILHSTPKAGEHEVDFDTFAAGKTVYAKASGINDDTLLTRASEILSSPANYQLLQHNCEHTAKKVLGEQIISEQLSEIETWALVGGAYGKSFGKKTMYIGGFLGALGGLLSLPRMWWIK